MGLDPDSSYIVVISGEESENTSGTYAYGDNLITPMPNPGDNGGSYFSYTYEGKAYTMRYVTVTAADNTDLSSSFSRPITYEAFPESWDELLQAVLCFCADAMTKVPIASILSLLVDVETDSNLRLLESEQLTIIGNCLWTLKYIQIYNFSEEVWVSAQSSEYADSKTFAVGYLYNAEENKSERFVGNESTFTTPSDNYHDPATCKEQAAYTYVNYPGTVYRDTTGDIDFYLRNEQGDIDDDGDGKPLCTLPHWK